MAFVLFPLCFRKESGDHKLEVIICPDALGKRFPMVLSLLGVKAQSFFFVFFFPSFSPHWLSREAGKYYCAKTPTTLTPVQIKETQPKQFQAWSNSLQEKNAYLRSYPLVASNYRDSLRSSHIKKKKKNVVIPIFLCWKISCSFPLWNLILTLKPCWVKNQTFTRSRIKKGGLTKPKT